MNMEQPGLLQNVKVKRTKKEPCQLGEDSKNGPTTCHTSPWRDPGLGLKIGYKRTFGDNGRNWTRQWSCF